MNVKGTFKQVENEQWVVVAGAKALVEALKLNSDQLTVENVRNGKLTTRTVIGVYTGTAIIEAGQAAIVVGPKVFAKRDTSTAKVSKRTSTSTAKVSTDTLAGNITAAIDLLVRNGYQVVAPVSTSTSTEQVPTSTSTKQPTAKQVAARQAFGDAAKARAAERKAQAHVATSSVSDALSQAVKVSGPVKPGPMPSGPITVAAITAAAERATSTKTCPACGEQADKLYIHNAAGNLLGRNVRVCNPCMDETAESIAQLVK